MFVKTFEPQIFIFDRATHRHLDFATEYQRCKIENDNLKLAFALGKNPSEI